MGLPTAILYLILNTIDPYIKIPYFLHLASCLRQGECGSVAFKILSYAETHRWQELADTKHISSILGYPARWCLSLDECIVDRMVTSRAVNVYK